jgi:uncharacterized protein DUF4192
MRTPPQAAAVQVEGPGELVAALPHLLAFHPVDSLVALVLSHGRPTRVAMSLRVDLPAPRHRRALAHQLLTPIRSEAGSVVLVVVGGGTPDLPRSLPHQGLIDCMESVLATADIRLAGAVWASGTTEGAQWVGYGDVGRTGTVPDPTVSEMAAACAAAGMVTFASRADLAAVLTPDDPEALSRREALLDEAALHAEDDQDREQSARKGLSLITRAVTGTSDRTTPLSDHEIVTLTTALSDLWVRDMSLVFATGPHATAAERLWTELTRATPIPERAQAATLLAFSAYLRGDGALASVALDRAEEACPSHRLASLVRAALDHALPPDQVARMAMSSSHPDWTPDGPQWP